MLHQMLQANNGAQLSLSAYIRSSRSCALTLLALSLSLLLLVMLLSLIFLSLLFSASAICRFVSNFVCFKPFFAGGDDDDDDGVSLVPFFDTRFDDASFPSRDGVDRALLLPARVATITPLSLVISFFGESTSSVGDIAAMSEALARNDACINYKVSALL